jgi:hypothetical protein
MKANKTHISLETAKLLKDCGVGSDYAYIDEGDGYDAVLIKYWETIDGEWGSCRSIVFKGIIDNYSIEGIYAYTWQEILWENAEEFFGKENHYNVTINNLIDKNGFDYIATQILILLQQKKYDEADKYFRENCKLIKI